MSWNQHYFNPSKEGGKPPKCLLCLLCDSTWLFLRRSEEVARVWLVPKGIRAGAPGRTSLGLILKTAQLSSGQGRAQLAESLRLLFFLLLLFPCLS